MVRTKEVAKVVCIEEKMGSGLIIQLYEWSYLPRARKTKVVPGMILSSHGGF